MRHIATANATRNDGWDHKSQLLQTRHLAEFRRDRAVDLWEIVQVAAGGEASGAYINELLTRVPAPAPRKQTTTADNDKQTKRTITKRDLNECIASRTNEDSPK